MAEDKQDIQTETSDDISQISSSMDRFKNVFEAIRVNIEEQTTILRSMLSIDQAQTEIQRRRDQFNELEEKTNDTSGNVSLDGDLDISDIQDQIKESLEGFSEENIRHALRGAGITAGIAGAALATFIRTIKRSALGLLIAASSFVIDDAVEYMAKNVGFSDEEASKLAESISWGTLIGGIAFIINKKLGLAIGIGSAAGRYFGERLANVLGLTDGDVIEIFGKEIQASQLVEGLIGLITGGLVLAIMGSSVSVFSGLLAGMPLLIAGGIATAYFIFGDKIRKWIRDQNLPSGFEDLAITAFDVGGPVIAGASLGAMFGPGGMIIGAALGFVYVLGEKIYDWLRNEKDKAINTIDDEINRRNVTNQMIQKAEELGFDKYKVTRALLPENFPDAPESDIQELRNFIETMPSGIFQEVFENMLKNSLDQYNSTGSISEGQLRNIELMQNEWISKIEKLEENGIEGTQERRRIHSLLQSFQMFLNDRENRNTGEFSIQYLPVLNNKLNELFSREEIRHIYPNFNMPEQILSTIPSIETGRTMNSHQSNESMLEQTLSTIPSIETVRVMNSSRPNESLPLQLSYGLPRDLYNEEFFGPRLERIIEQGNNTLMMPVFINHSPVIAPNVNSNFGGATQIHNNNVFGTSGGNPDYGRARSIN